jgi:hypothetical protein
MQIIFIYIRYNYILILRILLNSPCLHAVFIYLALELQYLASIFAVTFYVGLKESLNLTRKYCVRQIVKKIPFPFHSNETLFTHSVVG